MGSVAAGVGPAGVTVPGSLPVVLLVSVPVGVVVSVPGSVVVVPPVLVSTGVAAGSVAGGVGSAGVTVPGSDVLPVPSGGVPMVSVVSPVLVSVPVLPGAVAGSVAGGVASGWVPASVPIDVSGAGVLPVPSAGVTGVLPVMAEVSSMAGRRLRRACQAKPGCSRCRH